MKVQSVTEFKTLLSAMFPADDDFGVPCISSLSSFEKFSYEVSKIGAVGHIIAECPYNSSEEVDEYIKHIKKRVGIEKANEFIAACLEFYFGHPEIVENLTNKKSPLFPNETMLETIDIDLLEPVYERYL